MKRTPFKHNVYYTDQTLGGRKRLIPLSRKYIVDALSVNRINLLHKYHPLPSLNDGLSLKQGLSVSDFFSEKYNSPRKREFAVKENFHATDSSALNEAESFMTENSSAKSSKTLICNRCKEKRNPNLAILAKQRCAESKRIQTEIPVVVKGHGAKINDVINTIEYCNKVETLDQITKEGKYRLSTISEQEEFAVKEPQ